MGRGPKYAHTSAEKPLVAAAPGSLLLYLLSALLPQHLPSLRTRAGATAAAPPLRRARGWQRSGGFRRNRHFGMRLLLLTRLPLRPAMRFSSTWGRRAALPIMSGDGYHLGGIGVSGDSGANDAICAQAGIDAAADDLK